MTFTTIEAEVDERGQIQAKELLRLPPESRVLITLLDTPREAETALLSEAALADFSTH
jgi:hypothetical protein